MLHGCGKVTDTDTVGYEAGKRRYDGLGSFDETEMVKVCHNILNLDIDDLQNEYGRYAL